MACTEAVDTVIGEVYLLSFFFFFFFFVLNFSLLEQHYNDQIRKLLELDPAKHEDLKQVIKKFRDEELEHLSIAVDLDAQKAPLHNALSAVIQTGCKAAIWISTRI